MTLDAQMSFFDDEPQPEKTNKTQPSGKPKTAKNKKLSGEMAVGIVVAKAMGATPWSVDEILDRVHGDVSPFLSSDSGEFDEQFEQDELPCKAKSNNAKQNREEAYSEGLEEPSPFKPKREYSRYVLSISPTEDFLVYQWQVRTLPNSALVGWMQLNPGRVQNPNRWAAAYDLLRKMAHREAPWELLERIEEELGLDKRDLLDALIACEALGVIKGKNSFQ